MAELLDQFISPEVIQLINSDVAWHYGIVPVKEDELGYHFLVGKDKDVNLIKEELEVVLGRSVAFNIVDQTDLNKLLGKYYRNTGTTNKEFKFDKNVDFVDRLIQEANKLNSSDIHIEIYSDVARVRIRIDGHLIQRYTIDKSDYPELVNKIKIRSNLDISEKRLPQDGRINYDDFDIRVSILPTLYGEKIVMRILGHDASSIDIELLGMSESEKEHYLRGVRKPNGIILISGPTGSGKTTTLYATLKLLNSEKRNIVTVEDPIEYTLDGINQVQLKESIGLTFASALKSFLRQDPDVIMLGEIRDPETAEMAIRAALTGHLVLSTIHTNSAWGTISRLRDMGVPSFLLSNTINTSVAQRLVRKLCNNCKQKESIDKTIWPIKDDKFPMPGEVYSPGGCEDCHYTGYKGRLAIYEVIPVDSELSDLIKDESDTVEQHYKSRNIRSIKDRAYSILTKGDTSLEEVYPLLIERS